MDLKALITDPVTQLTGPTIGLAAIVVAVNGEDVSGDPLSDFSRIGLFLLGAVVLLVGLTATRRWALDDNGDLKPAAQVVSVTTFLAVLLFLVAATVALVRDLDAEDRVDHVMNSLGDYLESLEGDDVAKQKEAAYDVFAECSSTDEIDSSAIRAEVDAGCLQLLDNKGVIGREEAKGLLEAIAALR